MRIDFRRRGKDELAALNGGESDRWQLIRVHLEGGEVMEFHADPKDWFYAFNYALRTRCGIQIKDPHHGGHLGLSPLKVVNWEAWFDDEPDESPS